MTWQWVVFTLIICLTIVVMAAFMLAFQDNQVVAGESGRTDRAGPEDQGLDRAEGNAAGVGSDPPQGEAVPAPAQQ